jgi:hypothetical protein
MALGALMSLQPATQSRVSVEKWLEQSSERRYAIVEPD